LERYFMLPVGGSVGAAVFAIAVLVALLLVRPLWKAIAIVTSVFLLVFASWEQPN
jgi:hypothetical protein